MGIKFGPRQQESQKNKGRRALPGALPLLLLMSLLAGSLAGCVNMRDPETSQEQSGQYAGVVRPGRPVSQTLISRHAGLNQITIWASQPGNIEESLTLHFELFVPEEEPARFSTEALVTPNGPLVFSFPPQPDPPGQVYQARFSIQNGEVQIYGSQEDVYPYGQAFAGETALEGDLAFRTTYAYGPQAALEDLANLARQSWLLLPLLVLLVAPGWLILDVLDLRRYFDPGEQTGLSLGLGLAALPLVMLWTSTVGMRWSWGAVVGGAVLLLAGILWQVLRRPFHLNINNIRKLPWSSIILAGIFVLTLWLRLAMVRDLAAPAWVDSVHHALITRLIMEGGGFPESYAPYFALEPTQYHAGFHAGVAAFTWLARLDLPEALIFYGQFLNAFSVVAVYLLTVTFTRSRKAGLAAALLTGLVTPMPAYYASWGRYTQLAGMLILPVAPALLKLVWERETPAVGWRGLLASGLALGGLLLVHYRVAAFAALLLVGYVISQVRFSLPGLRSLVTRTAIYGSLLAVGPLLLSAPWTVPTLARHIFPVLSQDMVTETSAFGDFAWRYLTAGMGTYSIILAVLGLGWAGWQRQRFTAAMLLWISLMFGLANLGALGLPGDEFVNNTSVQIALFMPISLLGGYAAAGLWQAWHPRLPAKLRLLYRGLGLLLMFTLAFLGGRELMTILNPVTELFRAPDRPAMEWIRAHVPEDETILINPFNWGYGVYAGADGGFWISALTGRQTLPPPVLYGMGPRGETRRISDLARETTAYGGNPQGLRELMMVNNLEYIYLGGRGGVISAKALRESPDYRLVYDQEGVSIFMLLED